MNLSILFLLFLNVNAFINKRIMIKRQTIKLNTIHIQPLKTIALYNITNEQKKQIKSHIDNRFTMEPVYLNDNIVDCIGLTLYKYNTSTNSTLNYKCQVFAYVKDKHTNKKGQYILQSTEYNYGLNVEKDTVMCSFCGSNFNYTSMISYFQDIFDVSFYSNYNYFDFIYENNKMYMNLRNDAHLNNNIRYPEYKYMSYLKYNNMLWQKANLIIYYKNKFDYELIDEVI